MKQVEADVAIISAGTAGLAAAITAAESGARVIAFEKSSRTGGTAVKEDGCFAVESRLQRLKQYALTREETFKIYMDFSQWGVNARLVKALIDKSADTIDWLEKIGIEFYDISAGSPGMYYTYHLVREREHRSGFGAAAAMMDIMAERAKDLGVDIVLETPVTHIFKEGDRVAGFIAENRDGTEIRADARAVIIATGGFGGYYWGHSEITGLIGDGIRMSREVGAEAFEGNLIVRRGGWSLLPDHAPSVFAAFMQPNLMVNLSGERFLNEADIVLTGRLWQNAVLRQKNQCAFAIFDQDTKERYVATGLDSGYDSGATGFREPLAKAGSFDAELQRLLDDGTDTVWVADTLEELAGKTGIKPDILLDTIEEYNKACETGRDDALGVSPRYLKQVKRPKFYAGKITASSSGSLEGIRVNHKTEVVTRNYDVVPGLYAAGIDIACNLYRDIYPDILPGNTMGFALNSGRIAAENALKYVKSIAE